MKKLFGSTARLYQQAYKSSQVRLPDEQVRDYFDWMRAKTIKLQNADPIELQASLQEIKQKSLEAQQAYYLQELHQALALGNFELASRYLTPNNLHFATKYGDTPIILALGEKQWGFLSVAEQCVTERVKCPDAFYSIVQSEHDEQTQREMLGCAEHFYIINDPI